MTNLPPFRFGVSVGMAPSALAWRERVRRAEAVGFDLLYAADHLVPGSVPLSALGAAAEATERLRFGTYVTNNDLRHPALLAQEAAGLALVSDGRFELALGAGWAIDEYTASGLTFDPPAVRVGRLEEAVPLVQRLLAGEEVTATGAHYQLQGLRITSAPVPVPLVVGGNGKRVLGLAGRVADGVGFTGFTLPPGGPAVLSHFSAAGLADRLDVVRAAAGERFGELMLSALVQVVELTDNRRAAAEAMAERFGIGRADHVLDCPFVLVGTAAHIAADLIVRRERFGIGTWVVFGELPGGPGEQRLDALAPVIELLR
jgi:probable F420-dependent oxidoreductase